MSAAACLALISVCLAAGPPDTEFNELRNNYEFGKYDVVLRLAEGQIAREKAKEQPSTALLISLYQYAGVASFNLGKLPQAETFFVQLLQLDPDFGLDPFVYPPPAVTFLEKLKRENAKLLDALRESRHEEAAKRKREQDEVLAKERERRVREQEEQRRKIEQLTRGAGLVRVIERRSFALNFVPFGAGQFQQGRNGMGVLFLSVEGTLAIASIAGFFALNGLIDREYSVLVEDRLGSPVRVPAPGIPRSREAERNAWRLVKFGSGGAFYAAYILGVLDAVLHHQDEVVSSAIEEAPASTLHPGASLRPFLFPLSGGAGAGLTLHF